MARGEMEETARGTVEPYQGGAGGHGQDLVPYVPTVSRKRAPDYMAIRPHTDGWGQAGWSRFITPYRAFLHFQLWMTLTWWRPAIMLAVIIGVVSLIFFS